MKNKIISFIILIIVILVAIVSVIYYRDRRTYELKIPPLENLKSISFLGNIIYIYDVLKKY